MSEDTKVISILPRIEEKRYEVNLDTNEHSITQAVLTAFYNSNRVFQRAGFLVEPKLDPARKLKGLIRPIDEFKMVAMKPARVRSLAAEICYFKKSKGEGNPPDWLGSAILSLNDWETIPVVESISENPVIRPDGTIHDTPGHDPITGNYFAWDGAAFPPVPENPTLEDAKEAYRVLMDPLCDFPFVEPSDRSAAGAMILTLLARSIIAGPTPPFVIRTPTPRTGKDLLTDAISLIATGREVSRRALPRDDAELRKQLLAIALAGSRSISFGNCEMAIGSPVLSHAVTSEMISDRLLGSNTDISVPLRSVFFFNGNNPSYKGDFGPRVIECRMDAKVPDPQARTNWKYYPLQTYLKSGIRPSLVTAGLTVLRAYHLAGRPRHGKPRKGSFERWDDLIRGVLLWMGEADPVTTNVQVDDVDIETLRQLIAAWRCAFGSTPKTLKEAVAFAKNEVGGVQDTNGSSTERMANVSMLNAAFIELDPDRGDRYNAGTLRYRFRAFKERPVDMDEVDDEGNPEILCIHQAKEKQGHDKVSAWTVADIRGGTPRPLKRDESLLDALRDI